MDPNIPDYLYSFNIFATALLLVSVLGLIWFGTRRIPGPRRESATTAGILAFGLLGWLAIAEFLAQKNVYIVSQLTMPTLPYGLLAPIAIALFLMLRSHRIARLIDAIPLSWLVGVQFYRALGVMFLILWWGGFLPWQFAVPAGTGDIATGVLALVVAGMLIANVKNAQSAAYAWCLFGIADLVVAFTMGGLTSPGRIHFVSLDAPNLLISAYPLVMIPTFAVPVSIILHFLSLWKLRRLRRDASVSQAAGA